MRPILSDRNSLLKWLVPLIMGFVCVLLGSTIYKALHPNYPKRILEMSKSMRLPPNEAQELDRLSLKVANGERVTEEQWKAIQRIVQSDNVAQQRSSLFMLGMLNKTKYRQEAIGYAAELVNSSDSFVKARSISVLAHLHDSRWKGLALQNLNSPDPVLKSSATALLRRQDQFK